MKGGEDGVRAHAQQRESHAGDREVVQMPRRLRRVGGVRRGSGEMMSEKCRRENAMKCEENMRPQK